MDLRTVRLRYIVNIDLGATNEGDSDFGNCSLIKCSAVFRIVVDFKRQYVVFCRVPPYTGGAECFFEHGFDIC